MAVVLTGARLSELLQIRCHHVNLEGSYIRVPLSRKSGKMYDDVPISRDMASLLQKIKLDPTSDDYLFVPGYANRKSLGQLISHAFTHYRRVAGLDDAFSFHTCRSTYVTMMFNLIGEEALTLKHGKDIAIRHYLEQRQQAKKFSTIKMLSFEV